MILFDEEIIMSVKLSRKYVVDDDERQNIKMAERIDEDVEEEIEERMAEEIYEELDEGMVALAELMFHPEGKNPYYLNGRVLNNLQDLVGNLDAFTGNEGLWVASWLEYLGDNDVAARIQNWPDDFKPIVIARYNKLTDYHSCIKCGL